MTEREPIPHVTLLLPIEGRPAIRLTASTYEEEQALKAWLRLSEATADAVASLASLEDAA